MKEDYKATSIILFICLIAVIVAAVTDNFTKDRALEDLQKSKLKLEIEILQKQTRKPKSE